MRNVERHCNEDTDIPFLELMAAQRGRWPEKDTVTVVALAESAAAVLPFPGADPVRDGSVWFTSVTVVLVASGSWGCPAAQMGG